ncbi:MAG: glycosyltransferase family 2 protein [Nitriliruptoraceae bacterium]|nr:glycosyltransferase family 2 protein [Nitriliruptoraceae bacterium]
MSTLLLILAAANLLVLAYFVAFNVFQTVLITSAGLSLGRHHRTTWCDDPRRLLGSEVAPPISVLAPAHNEAATIVESVRALLALRYPRMEIVVVNDGSTDETLARLADAFALAPVEPVFRRRLDTAPIRGLYRSRLHPRLVVVDKDNGGKADALNAALNVITGELACALDADTLVESDALLRMVRPFLRDPRVVAVGGTIRVVNGSEVSHGRVLERRVPRQILPGIQTVEYLRAFLFGRLGWNRLGGNLIISGAFGLFDREAVLLAGGYEAATVGEDMELIAKIRRRGVEAGVPSRVEFLPDPIAWTEVPSSLRVLAGQRDRWHRGLADALWRHRRMMGNPRYGVLGTFVAPTFLLLELLAPVVELLGLVAVGVALALGAVDGSFALLLLLVAYGWGLLLSLLAIALEEFSFERVGSPRDRLRLILWAVIEPFGYRQLTVYWRLRGLSRWLRGRTDWGTMHREGFVLAPTTTTTT